jgi:formate/nitrite transporter FocA (FNT family)
LAPGQPGKKRPVAKVEQTFDESVAEGVDRLDRTWPGLLATGMVGGLDVGVGVFALYLVREQTDQPLLGALAFTIGFVALTLASSELFTENFLMPIAVIATRRARVRDVLRLWGGTLATNLVGGWVMMLLVIDGFPSLHRVAVDVGSHYYEVGIGWRSFCTAVLGGGIITLMTWMERATPSVPGKLAAAVAAGFLLAAGELNHAIVLSLEMFSALQVGAPFGYLDWLRVVAWAILGNMIGGIGFVTALRLVQVGSEKLERERERAD